MNGAGSKSKGASFERKTCEQLSLWVSCMTRTDVFWRAAMSGGRASLKKRQNNDLKYDAQAGDISATHEMGHLLLDVFTIDCKFYKDLGMIRWIWNNKCAFHDDWLKLIEGCDAVDKLPLMVVRQNRLDTLLILDCDGAELFSTIYPKLQPHAVFPLVSATVYMYNAFLATDYKTFKRRVGELL